jgi:predicted alpha/beta hydrolase
MPGLVSVQEITTQAADGYEVPLEFFPATAPRAQLLVLPALGIQARLYRRLGALLAEAGINTAAMEQRGHGRSALRPSRQCDYGFREWLQQDIPAALAWLQEKAPGTPVFLAGHSLGGHLSLVARALYPRQVSGVILFTTATPYYGCFHGLMRWQVRFLIASIPIVTSLLGYYPGDRMGLGGREARRLMDDWLVMARSNRYGAEGMQQDLEQLVQSDACPVLSIYCDQDNLAPLQAIEGVTRRLRGHDVDWFEITSEALGARADHASWAKHPDGAAEAITRWIGAQPPGANTGQARD